jgi:hypothetical protein
MERLPGFANPGPCWSQSVVAIGLAIFVKLPRPTARFRAVCQAIWGSNARTSQNIRLPRQPCQYLLGQFGDGDASRCGNVAGFV